MPEGALALGFDGGTARPTVSLFPLEVESLAYVINGKRLLEDVSFRVEPHKITVVMGPNGAGKSLLLRLMHGLIEPTSGRISWGGRPAEHEVRRRQAMVFQRPVLLRRSVIANLEFALRSRGISSERRCLDLLEHVGLSGHAATPARRLSGGEQQRLALARALAVEPEVLFLDEPTASLDPASTAAIEAIVEAAHRRGTKIIFVTHNIGQARRLAHEVLFLHDGRLVEQTPASEFFIQPSSPQARGYVEGRLVY